MAGIGGPPAGDGDASGWTSYIWVGSADAAAAAVLDHGGQVLLAPVDIPRAGRVAVCSDPTGAVFGLWQAAENRRAELVNAPGTWNFNDLTTGDVLQAEAFYGAVFGWVSDPFAMSAGEKAAIPAIGLGATAVTPLFDTDYTRMSTVKDPQDGILTLSEYRPPQPSS